MSLLIPHTHITTPNLPPLNIGSPTTNSCKQIHVIKKLQILFHSKTSHTIYKNKRQHTHGQYNSRVNECS